MARNVEIKATIESVEALAPRAAALADEGPIAIEQDDTFFRCEHGRLKLRVLAENDGEIIFYRRADQRGPKESEYLRTPISSPEALRRTLAMAYGEIGRVRKRRILYLAGRTRIHIDRVEGLGDFLELEVVLEEGEPVDAGVREAQTLMEQLGVEPSHLIECAYVDLHAPALWQAACAGSPAPGNTPVTRREQKGN